MLTNSSVAFPALEYGPDHGDPRLRKHLASWLTTFYKPQDPITDDRITISGGASQNLAVLLNVFTDPSYTRKVWFVAPAYHLSFRVIQDAGFHDKFRAIPEDEEGIDIEYFKNEIKKVEEKATSEGINQPVSAWKFPNLRFTCDSCFDRNCLIRLPDDVSPCRCMTDSAIRNINRYHGLGRRCTSMSSTQYQRSLIRHPRL